MSEALFSDPPWRGGARRFRLGLRPIEVEAWFPHAISAQEAARKSSLMAAVGRDAYDVHPCANGADVLAARAVSQHVSDSSTDNLREAAVLVPDDLCVMRHDGKSYRLVAASLCSPSYWRLQDKMGQTLAEIHSTHDGLNDEIGSRMARFFDRLPAGQIFERRNWFVHSDFEPYHPEYEDLMEAAPEALVVRSERQTLTRLDERSVLFTIDVQMAPLAELAGYPEAAGEMRRAIATWSLEERTAFGLHRLTPAFDEYLKSLESTCASP